MGGDARPAFRPWKSVCLFLAALCVATFAGEAQAQHHKVKPGETLVSIAMTHHTTVAALKRDNGNLALLRPGMVLVIKDVR